MVKLLLLNLFIPFITYCQVDHIVIKKEKSTSLFANISGYSEGEIGYSLICSEIEANNFSNYEVTEFKISFGTKDYIVSGNRIPDTICFEIANCCINSMIFFTNIMGVNKDDESLIYLLPLNLTLVKND